MRKRANKIEYLPSATDFTGFEKKPDPTIEVPESEIKYPCPVCRCHGGWNLRLNAYGPGKHFQASCFQCSGWGWVTEKDRGCVHEFSELSQKECAERGIQHFGRCWHVYECSRCKRISAADSSD